MIFRRALVRELSLNAIFVFVVLVAIMVTQTLIKLIGAASSGALPVDGLIPMVGFRIIAVLAPLVVIAMFISVLLTLSRAWRDSEMAIWMSAGLSLNAWLKPVMVFSIPVLLGAAALSLTISPWAEKRSTEYRRVLEARDELSAVAPGLFQEMRKTRQVYFVESTDLLNGKINNVFVFADDPNGPSITRAEHGFIRGDSDTERYVILEKGHRVKKIQGKTSGAPDAKNAKNTQNANEYELGTFERYGIHLGNSEVADDPFEDRAKSVPTLIAENTPTGMGQLFYRLSIPLVGLSFVLLAIPLAYVNPRLGRSANLLIAILLIMTALSAINIVQAYIERKIINLPIAMIVFHSILFAIAASVFYRRYLGVTFKWPWQRKTIGAASTEIRV